MKHSHGEHGVDDRGHVGVGFRPARSLRSRGAGTAAVLALAVLLCGAAPQAASAPAGALASGTLAEQLSTILHRLDSKGIVIAARVIDPETGKELYAQAATRPMIPASNMKLTVTAAALDFFGPAKTFETDLLAAGDDLYLVGSGDPASGDEAIAKKAGRKTFALFDAWADELLAKGLTRFSGNLYYVDTALERQQTHPSWGSDLTEWYGAPVGGLNLNDNCVDITVSPGDVGSPATVKVLPDTSAVPEVVTVVNRTRTAAAPATRTTPAATRPAADAEPNADRDLNRNVYTLTGTVTQETELGSHAVTDPGQLFAAALKTHLAARGITVEGKIYPAYAVPREAAAKAVKLAPAVTAFSDILWRINKNSQNMFTEAIAKGLGQAYDADINHISRPAGTWKNAEEAIRAFFTAHEIDTAGFEFADGSGLSRDNRVTSNLITGILRTMYHHKHAEVFRASMTIGGVDGTIRSRFKDLPNRVYAKTGTLTGVRSLSGYVKTDEGKWLIFSIIANQIPREVGNKPVEEAQDDAVRLLMKYPGVH